MHDLAESIIGNFPLSTSFSFFSKKYFDDCIHFNLCISGDITPNDTRITPEEKRRIEYVIVLNLI